MSQRLPSLISLRAFESSARLRSFKKAADELAVTAAAISHRIRDLEEFLERPLFIRKVRAVELTPEAERLYLAVHHGFETMAQAIDHIRRPQRANVTLSATPAFAAKWLVPRLAAFQAQHPDIDLHVHASNAPADLEAGNVDLAIRYGLYPSATDGNASATLLLQDQFAPVARPAMAHEVKQGFAHWPLIHFDWQERQPKGLTWNAWAQAAGYPLSALSQRAADSSEIRYSEETHAIQAAVAGQGVALLSVVLVEEELRLGLLKVVAPPMLEAFSYRLLKSGRSQHSEPVEKVERWLVAQARKAKGIGNNEELSSAP